MFFMPESVMNFAPRRFFVDLGKNSGNAGGPLDEEQELASLS